MRTPPSSPLSAQNLFGHRSRNAARYSEVEGSRCTPNFRKGILEHGLLPKFGRIPLANRIQLDLSCVVVQQVPIIIIITIVSDPPHFRTTHSAAHLPENLFSRAR